MPCFKNSMNLKFNRSKPLKPLVGIDYSYLKKKISCQKLESTYFKPTLIHENNDD